MTPPPFVIGPLEERHDRAAFRCREPALDKYFQTQATQDIRRRIANCFVAVERTTDIVVAFYTLSTASIPIGDLPPEVTKRLPRYASLPAVRIGRLAVDERYQGRGLGSAMLMDAAARTARADVAAFTLLVDAKNDNAVEFYKRFGFQTIVDQPRCLFLPLATAQRDLGL